MLIVQSTLVNNKVLTSVPSSATFSPSSNFEPDVAAPGVGDCGIIAPLGYYPCLNNFVKQQFPKCLFASYGKICEINGACKVTRLDYCNLYVKYASPKKSKFPFISYLTVSLLVISTFSKVRAKIKSSLHVITTSYDYSDTSNFDESSNYWLFCSED